MAKGVGITERYLRKLMIRHTGLGPKRLARIFRVTRTVGQADKGWPFGWAGLAVANGYYDQAHMIDEFQELLGASPERFIHRKNREAISSVFSNTNNPAGSILPHY